MAESCRLSQCLCLRTRWQTQGATTDLTRRLAQTRTDLTKPAAIRPPGACHRLDARTMRMPRKGVGVALLRGQSPPQTQTQETQETQTPFRVRSFSRPRHRYGSFLSGWTHCDLADTKANASRLDSARLGSRKTIQCSALAPFRGQSPPDFGKMQAQSSNFWAPRTWHKYGSFRSGWTHCDLAEDTKAAAAHTSPTHIECM